MLSEWKEEKELARNREWGGGPRQREKHVQMPRGGSDSPSNIVATVASSPLEVSLDLILQEWKDPGDPVRVGPDHTEF